MSCEHNCRENHECGSPCDEVRGIVTGYGRFSDDDCHEHGCDGNERCRYAHIMIAESLDLIKKGIEDDRRGVKAIRGCNYCPGVHCICNGIMKCHYGINELKRNLYFAFDCFDCEEEKFIRRGLCLLEKGQHEEMRGLNFIRHCQIGCGIRECEKGIHELVRGVEEIEKNLHKHK